jgi:hypothetical protein
LGDRGNNIPTTTSSTSSIAAVELIAAESITTMDASVAAASIAAESITIVAAASITSDAARAVITFAETNVRGAQDIVLERHAEITVGCGETRI